MLDLIILAKTGPILSLPLRVNGFFLQKMSLRREHDGYLFIMLPEEPGDRDKGSQKAFARTSDSGREPVACWAVCLGSSSRWRCVLWDVLLPMTSVSEETLLRPSIYDRYESDYPDLNPNMTPYYQVTSTLFNMKRENNMYLPHTLWWQDVNKTRNKFVSYKVQYGWSYQMELFGLYLTKKKNQKNFEILSTFPTSFK